MKKKSLIMLLCLCCVFSLVACGKTEEEKEMEEIAEDLEDLGFTDDEIDELEELFEEETFDSEQNSLEENREKEYKKYDAVMGWEEVELHDLAVQVDDQLYVGGCTVKDIVEQINLSEIEYSYDINLDKLVQTYKDETLTVFRDGVEWFDIVTFNLSEENGILANNIVMSINVKKDAYPYSRFIDGRSYDELLELSYNDVLALQDSLFLEDEWKYDEDSTTAKGENGESHDVFRECYILNDVDQPRFFWTGYGISTNTVYEFFVNCDSGKVEKFSKSYWGFSYGEMEPIQYTSMADIKEEELNEFIMNAESALIENTGAVSNELISIYLFEDCDRLSLLFLYKIIKDDGSEKYAYIQFLNVGSKPIGGIRYDENYEWDERDISEGAYEVTDSLAIELLDKMEYAN